MEGCSPRKPQDSRVWGVVLLADPQTPVDKNLQFSTKIYKKLCFVCDISNFSACNCGFCFVLLMFLVKISELPCMATKLPCMLSCVLITLPQKKHWLQDNIFTLPIKITKTRTKSKLVVRYVQSFAKAPKK